MHLRFLTFALTLLSVTGCGEALGEGEDRTQRLFADNCAFCHGSAGEGKDDLQFPAIAGLPEWYVAAQLKKFKDGVRGAHAKDVNGLRMRPMARALEVEDIPGLATYVASMTRAEPSRSVVHGEAEIGKASYATCTACHGADGKGNEALNAPPIAQLDDWYIALQLQKFKSGIRGADPRDTTGAQMRPMAATLADDAAIQNVVAYIGTLK